MAEEIVDKSVVGRTFMLLNSFKGRKGAVSLSELSQRTGLPKPTVHRLATQLVEQGALDRTKYGYQVGMSLFELGSTFASQRGLRDLANPFITDLVAATQATVHFGVLDGIDVVYMERMSPHNAIDIPTSPGARMPSYCSGIGKALLAFSPSSVVDAVIDHGLAPLTPRTLRSAESLRRNLATVRESGVAYDFEEGKLGVACVAAPVLDNSGRAIAAISVTTSTPRFHERFNPAVQLAAASLTRVVRQMRDIHWNRSLASDIIEE